MSVYSVHYPINTSILWVVLAGSLHFCESINSSNKYLFSTQYLTLGTHTQG